MSDLVKRLHGLMKTAHGLAMDLDDQDDIARVRALIHGLQESGHLIEALEAEVARLQACLKERDAMADRMEAENARLREALVALDHWFDVDRSVLDNMSNDEFISHNRQRRKIRAALAGEAD